MDKKRYADYSNIMRYPGYYNSGLYPESGRLPQESNNFPLLCNSSDQAQLRLCAVNLTGENRRAFDRDWVKKLNM